MFCNPNVFILVISRIQSEFDTVNCIESDTETLAGILDSSPSLTRVNDVPDIEVDTIKSLLKIVFKVGSCELCPIVILLLELESGLLDVVKNAILSFCIGAVYCKYL